MKIIVTGHKDADYGIIEAKLNKMLSKLSKKDTILVLAHGDPVAHLVEAYAFRNGYPREVHRPDYKRDSFAAVSVMHEEMLAAGAKVLVAFTCKHEDSQVSSLLARAPKHKCKIRTVRF